jgi:transposase
VAGRADLTDAQWVRLQPLLPRGKKAGRPPKWTKRQLIDGIRWRTRVGSPWRDVPDRYGHWKTVYGLFRRWQRAGVWAVILKMLQAFADAAGRIVWDVSVDSTIARAHQHAAGARHDGHTQVEPPGRVEDEPADHALGRTRGGWNHQDPPACEQGRKTLSIVITAGQRQGLQLARQSRVPARTRDQGHEPEEERLRRRSPARIRPRGLQTTPRCGVRHQPARANRAVATRYDKLAVRYQATVRIAAINQWL